jgi:putative effector of murein hydrolase
MFKRLMIAGGILNALFFLFHIFVGYRIQRLTELAANYRALLASFNIAGALFILFIVYASFLHHNDLLETRLGHALLAFASLLYLSRAAEEFILFKFDAAVFGSCLPVGALYAVALVLAIKRKGPAATLPLSK